VSTRGSHSNEHNPKGSARNESVSLQVVIHETKPHTKHIQHRLEPWIPNHSQRHCSLKFTFDSGEFACDPPKFTAQVHNQDLCGSIGGSRDPEQTQRTSIYFLNVRFEEFERALGSLNDVYI